MSRSQLREVWIIILKQIFPFFSFFFLFLSPLSLPSFTFYLFALCTNICVFLFIYTLCVYVRIYAKMVITYKMVFINFYTFLRIIIIIHGTDFMKFPRINQYIHSFSRVLFTKLIKKISFLFLAW